MLCIPALECPTADLHTVLSLIVIRANVRKHIKADNVKNPSYIMQKTCDLGLFLEVPFSFNFNVKVGTIKANTRHLLHFIHAKICITFRLSWASAGCF